MIEEKSNKKKNDQKFLRVYPKAFAVDEKLKQSLVIFEDAKGLVNFSVALGAPEEIMGLLKDSTHVSQGPYKLVSKMFESFNTQPRKAIIKFENEIDMCLKQKDIRGFKKLKTGMVEMLGLWNIYDFPIYSKLEFIESIRHVDLKSGQDTLQTSGDLYKAYGQKYLM